MPTARGEERHPIGVVAERTGLTRELLRAWERRYEAVRPMRTRSGQRLYTDEDVSRLLLLRRATRSGRPIAGVARLPITELTRLVKEDDDSRTRLGRDELRPLSVQDLNAALVCARSLDGEALHAMLRRWATLLGVPAFLERAAAPFMRRVGEEWHAGRLQPAHEHLATAVVQKLVLGLIGTLGPGEGAQVFLAASPAGERHEIGALLAAAAAAAEGWRVVFLGADLPGAEIAAAALASGARVVAVSVIYVEDPERVVAELRNLRRMLPPSVPVLVGGAGSPVVAHTELDRELIRITDLSALREVLWRWRRNED